MSEEESSRRGSRSNSLSNEMYENESKSKKQSSTDFETTSDESNDSNQLSQENGFNIDASLPQDSFNAGDDLEIMSLKNITSGLELTPQYEEFLQYRIKKIQKSIKMLVMILSLYFVDDDYSLFFYNIREKSPTKYNPKCRLVAIRRLRVITCMIGKF